MDAEAKPTFLFPIPHLQIYLTWWDISQKSQGKEATESPFGLMYPSGNFGASFCVHLLLPIVGHLLNGW